MAGSSVGKAYSLPRILKRLGNVSERGIQLSTSDFISHVSLAIREQVKAGMTMPQLIEQLRQSGVNAYVKYTRNKKVKGISYSFGDNTFKVMN
jgi:urease gamma subunit